MTPQQEDQVLEQAKIAGTAPRMNAEDAKKLIAAMPVEQILKDAQPKMEAAVMESAANDRAAREPLPGAYSDAFNVDPLEVQLSKSKAIIRPMVAYDINIFKLIESPFYRLMMGDKPTDDKDKLFASEEESYELIFQFTHEPKEIYKLFKQSKAAFKDKVMEEVAFKYNPVEAAMLVEKIMEHIFKVNMARIDFTSPEPESSDKKKLIPPATTEISITP